jgi:hypothetical protein
MGAFKDKIDRNGTWDGDRRMTMPGGSGSPERTASDVSSPDCQTDREV